MSYAVCFSKIFNSLMLVKGLLYAVLGSFEWAPLFWITSNINSRTLSATLVICIGYALPEDGSMRVWAYRLMEVNIYILFGLAFVMVFLGVWGLIGVFKRNTCMLRTSGVLLFVLLAIEVAMTVTSGVGLTNMAPSSSFTKENFVKSFQIESIRREFRKEFAKFEAARKCCGVDGFRDYLELTLPIPESCCVVTDGGGYVNELSCRVGKTGFVHGDGCWKYRGVMKPKMWMLLGIMIGLGFITLFAFVFTLCVSPRRMAYGPQGYRGIPLVGMT